MTEPEELDEGTPTIRIGGKDWPVPELGIRQLRKVRRPLFDLTDALTMRDGKKPGELFVDLTEEQYDALCEVVYQGLTRAHPTMSRDEFESLSASDIELLVAFSVVRKQSGLFKLVTAGDTPSGEAQAELSAHQSQTGTE